MVSKVQEGIGRRGRDADGGVGIVAIREPDDAVVRWGTLSKGSGR